MIDLNQKIKDLKIEPTNYECDKCKDKGFLLDNHNNFISYCTCNKTKKSQLKKDSVKLYLGDSNLENIYKRYTFESYQTPTEWHKDYKQRAIKFLNNPTNAFLYLAQSGNGKTHLMTALTVHLIAKGNSGLYVKFQDEMLKSKNHYWNIDNQLLHKMKTVDVLYLDDLFKVKELKDVHPEEFRIAMNIIDSRYTKDLITIISSEWNLQELIMLDEAFASRLIEMAGGMSSPYIIDAGYKKDGNWRLR